jgi:hypothetical protein
MPPHDHDHEPTDAGNSGDAVPGYYEIMETSIRELLVEKHLIGPGEIRRQIDVLDCRTPALGARVVARAWVDPLFRARLLAHESGRRLDEVVWREPGETSTPADRRCYQRDGSVRGACEPVGVGSVGGPAPVARPRSHTEASARQVAGGSISRPSPAGGEQP